MWSDVNVKRVNGYGGGKRPFSDKGLSNPDSIETGIDGAERLGGSGMRRRGRPKEITKQAEPVKENLVFCLANSMVKSLAVPGL
jgi:hypothetical protein